MSAQLIERIVEIIETGQESRAGLARAAGLHANSLRKLGEPDWNPTAETLGKLERYLSRDPAGVMATAEEIINEARNGRMYILVDDEDRENEGDLIIPAQMATPDAINFMAKYGRGLICLAMTRDRVEQLGLNLMSRNNGTRHETAFTVSIEARDGVTTGISAADRSRTVTVAIDPSKGPEEIVTPGHVFPLMARDGGVLVRAGHTEAAVDVSRLAGLNPSGVICEIMNDDGTMARLDDLIEFAHIHGMKIGTIRDLIAYRRRHDHLVERRAEARFTSRHGGEWKAIVFYNKAEKNEQIVLQKGHVDPDKPTLVRMHVLSPFSDIFGETGARSGVLGKAMDLIGEEGAGLVVLLNRHGINSLSNAVRMKSGEAVPDMEELRDYGIGAQILTEMGVNEMELLTNSHHSLVALDGYGLSIVGERPIPMD
ncbi:MAG: 3,4-dihydroxy-2-butanone-4-phosphate synthase [Sphingomonadales bacterium RIFCSPHIGHO2_01_FULL_65_20]|jgi:3,4-dihydroxy 2-butanone 4-phosphate synthase/GTP cyclohydrolase II|uniref:3,4-dihydroxy-2-butanone-4-phosphate synthase n=1 Tax=unclassified Blastomonas TaxID=2626550 RepID=UPI00082C9260|nr:3,4-dihydroxy-2-butanone-4-phosphate synthase [Blastomonas sp.]MCH2237665.1 3,4-dihydroxy-2-butanone-4-phosphate synthase [Blastomonas sp.]OHC96849.1 MAG: 3,4-dihydroxy-2-butanone-4-phosphate synthase [Sphingomonadales bacterium RIFCSPHIGHO2_01_FULL_65_20]